jgi:hypothetical protein
MSEFLGGQYSKRIKKAYNKGNFLGNSSQIVVVQHGGYVEILDEDLKRISKAYQKFDTFLGASGSTFSIQDGHYAETCDANGKRISKTYSKI